MVEGEGERSSGGTVWIVAILALVLIALVAWFFVRTEPGEQEPDVDVEVEVPEVGSAGDAAGRDAGAQPTGDEGAMSVEPGSSEDLAEDQDYQPGEPDYDDLPENPDGNQSEGDPVPPPP